MKLVTYSKDPKRLTAPYHIRHEARVLGQLAHKNVIKSYGSGVGILELFGADANLGDGTKVSQPTQACYIILEYFKEGSLLDKIRQRDLTRARVKIIIKEVLDALLYTYKMGWVHRDLKPQNIMFDNNFHVKLIDFGLACPVMGEYSNGLSYEAVGSEPYWPPELYHVSYPYGYIPEKMDVYSLGITLFEMAYFFSPFYRPYSWWSVNSFQQEQFWREAECIANVQPDPLLRNLLSYMLMPNPLYRPSLSSMLSHPWITNTLHAGVLEDAHGAGAD